MASWPQTVLTPFLRVASYYPPPLWVMRAAMEAVSYGFFLWHRPGETINLGDVAAEWLVPADCDPRRVLLYLHGGGFTTCSVNTHRELTCLLAHGLGLRALSVGYRLAPESPFPAAQDDALAAYCWLLGHGYAPSEIVVAGDSAGGGLAVSMLVRARDAGMPMPALLVLLSPWVDLAMRGESYRRNAHSDPYVRPAVMAEFARMYAGDRPLDDPGVSPLYAPLHGLPPMFVQASRSEPMLDDSLALAERIQVCGGDATVDLFDDAMHDFQAMALVMPEARQAQQHIAAWARDRLAAQVR